MYYTEFVRPHGQQHMKRIELDERSEALYQLVAKHPDAGRFTYEDCGRFINLCFEAQVDVGIDGDSDWEVMDVVCECVQEHDMPQAWQTVVAQAADHFGIHTIEFA